MNTNQFTLWVVVVIFLCPFSGYTQEEAQSLQAVAEAAISEPIEETVDLSDESEASEQDQENDVVAEISAGIGDDVIYPAGPEDALAKSPKMTEAPEESMTGMLSQMLVYLIILGLGAWLIVQLGRRGGFRKNLLSKEGETLKVAETKMLGNKQYLVVVEYGAQKMLLGVGPGMINQLCYLSSPYDDKAVYQDGGDGDLKQSTEG